MIARHPQHEVVSEQVDRVDDAGVGEGPQRAVAQAVPVGDRTGRLGRHGYVVGQPHRDLPQPWVVE